MRWLQSCQTGSVLSQDRYILLSGLILKVQVNAVSETPALLIMDSHDKIHDKPYSIAISGHTDGFSHCIV